MKRGVQIFFVRPPLPGRVKTRLADFLGKERACQIYQEMLVHQLRSFQSVEELAILLFSADREGSEWFREQGFAVDLAADSSGNPPAPLSGDFPAALSGNPPANFYIQSGGDLGQRMAEAFFKTARQEELHLMPILLAGSDAPDYSPLLARQALDLLQAGEGCDIVLGPAEDGGYYLIALQGHRAADAALLSDLFRDIPWSTERCLQAQIERIAALGLRVGLCRTLQDIDTFDDLLRYCHRAGGQRRREENIYAEFLPDIRAILPVLNEEKNLPFVLKPLLNSGCFRELICADNNSDDASREVARELGARVTICKRRGYGAACLTALRDIEERGGCEAVLFLDADGADDPDQIPRLLAPVVSDRYDLVLGARSAESSEPGALLPHARFGNWLSTFLIWLFWGFRFRDLGPFRAIRWEALQKLKMDDLNFGWTIQMQIRALKCSLRVMEIAVPYRRRHSGRSKVTASLSGALQAGMIILKTVFKELMSRSSVA